MTHKLVRTDKILEFCKTIVKRYSLLLKLFVFPLELHARQHVLPAEIFGFDIAQQRSVGVLLDEQNGDALLAETADD